MRPVVLLLALLAACGKPASEEPPPVATPQAVPEKIEVEAVLNTGRTAMYVPAPSEFEAALKASAPQVELASLVTDEVGSLLGKQRPVLALETGTRISNALMTAHLGDKQATLGRLRAAKEALVALQAPPKVIADVDKTLADYSSGAIVQDELVAALDQLGESIQDGLSEADKNTATLVQAGGWVQAAHLLSKALQAQKLTGDASGLLKQPSLVNHFQLFLRTSDAGRAGDPTIAEVLEHMEALRYSAGQEEIDLEGLGEIVASTGAIIAAFRRPNEATGAP